MKNPKLIFLILLFSCSAPSSEKGANNIVIGSYSFDFPIDYELIKERGIDSYVGRIVGDSIELIFDHGHYSNKLVKTEEEYFNSNDWHFQARNEMQTLDIPFLYNSSIEIISKRPSITNDSTKADYIVKFQADSTFFEFDLFFPEEMQQYEFRTDTVDGHYLKLVISNDSNNGITGLYIQDLNSNNTRGSNLSLSMSATNLTKEQQNQVLQILESIKW